MKKCPTCEKTFEDNLRFCQIDGTPLVEDAPAFDPYATIVSPGLPAAVPQAEPEPPAKTSASSVPTDTSASSAPINEPNDILEVPEPDPLKTMYVSDAEMKEVLGARDPSTVDARAIANDTTSPETAEPSATAPEPSPPSFRDMAPPPSPFSSPSGDSVELEPVAPPVDPEPYATPEAPAFDEAATIIQPHMSAGMPPQSHAPVEQWTPPPAPEPSWQNQPVGSDTPLQAQPAGATGQSQGLAIASLVCGILSLLCCNWFVVGIAAVVMGFIARSKANNDPANYTGAGLALGGIITGGVSMLIGIVFWILYVLGFVASVLNR